MRFSNRWLLVATAYVALAIAAIAAESYVLADLILALSLAALCFAIIVVCFASGQRRAIALGFMLFGAAHVLGQYLIPSRLPEMRLFSAAGYIVLDSGIYEPDPTNPTAYRGVHGFVPAISYCQCDGHVGCRTCRLPDRSRGVPIRGRTFAIE